MLKRKKLRDLRVGEILYINGRRYKCYGRVWRDHESFVAIYEDRLSYGFRKKLNYLRPDMEVFVEDGKKKE